MNDEFIVDNIKFILVVVSKKVLDDFEVVLVVKVIFIDIFILIEINKLIEFKKLFNYLVVKWDVK